MPCFSPLRTSKSHQFVRKNVGLDRWTNGIPNFDTAEVVVDVVLISLWRHVWTGWFACTYSAFVAFVSALLRSASLEGRRRDMM